MQFYNMMTCGGFSKEFGGGCSMAWVGVVLAVLIIMIARKWLFEEALSQDLSPMQFAIAIIATIFIYFIMVGFTGSFKWATLAASVGGLLVAYLSSTLIGGEGGGGASEF